MAGEAAKRRAEERLWPTRLKCVFKGASHLAMADVGPTCWSMQLRSWLRCKTGDKHKRQGDTPLFQQEDKCVHFTSRIFRRGVSNYIFLSQELGLQVLGWISCVERRIRIGGVCLCAPLCAIKGNLGVMCTGFALKVLGSGHIFTCWNWFWHLPGLEKNVISLIYEKNGDLGVDPSVVPCLCFHAVNKSVRKIN